MKRVNHIHFDRKPNQRLGVDTIILTACMVQHKQFHAELSERWEEIEEIADYAVNGKIYVRIWGRDCDHCESTRIAKIDASIAALESLRESVWDDAEGPTSVHIVTEQYAKLHKPVFRDHIAEAHEDGHPWSVAL